MNQTAPPMPLLEWLNERYENCLRLAMNKPKRIAVGWMEDAAYFQAAIIKLKAMKELLKVSLAASHALRSYQYGNSGPVLAEEVADSLDAAIAKAESKQ